MFMAVYMNIKAQVSFGDSAQCLATGLCFPRRHQHCKLMLHSLMRVSRVQDYFGAFGQLDEAMIMRDRDTGKSRGFGFVTYTHREDALRVARQEHHVDGR